jgi:hypothetical protein
MRKLNQPIDKEIRNHMPAGGIKLNQEMPSIQKIIFFEL